MTHPIHPLAGTADEVRAFEAASAKAAPAAVAVPDSSDLGFAVEQRGDVWVVVEDAGGVCPASSHECALWNALIEARAMLAAAPAAAEAVPQGVLDAARRAGMQLLRTADGYQLEKLSRNEASSTATPAAPVVLPDPVAWAISYDGKTPYALWPEGDGALLDTEIKRLGGTARKMPLYAAPAADALDASRADARDTELLDFVEANTVALEKEWEGPWQALVYGESESPSIIEDGKTPREALRAAIAAQAAAQGGE